MIKSLAFGNYIYNMNHLKYFESLIYGHIFGDDDLNMVEDLLTELDDIGLVTKIWTNNYRGVIKNKEKLKSIEIEVDIEHQSKKICDIVYSRLDKIKKYLISSGWKLEENKNDREYIFLEFRR